MSNTIAELTGEIPADPPGPRVTRRKPPDREDPEWRARTRNAHDVASRAATYGIARQLGCLRFRPEELRELAAAFAVRLPQSALSIVGVLVQLARHEHVGLRIDAKGFGELVGCARSTFFESLKRLRAAGIVVVVPQYETAAPGETFTLRCGRITDKRRASSVYRLSEAAAAILVRPLRRTMVGLVQRELQRHGVIPSRKRRTLAPATPAAAVDNSRSRSAVQGVRKTDTDVSLSVERESRTAAVSPLAILPLQLVQASWRSSALKERSPSFVAPHKTPPSETRSPSEEHPRAAGALKIPPAAGPEAFGEGSPDVAPVEDADLAAALARAAAAWRPPTTPRGGT